MGMFDTILVRESLILPLIDDDIKAVWKPVDGYFNFQTKDLDCSLDLYYIEENRYLYRDVVTYKEAAKPLARPWQAPFEEVSRTKKEAGDVTCYVTFYDSVGTVGEDDVFVTFQAHIDGGVMLGLCLLEISRDNLKQREERCKKIQKHWDNVKSTREWKLYDFLNNLEWKISRLLYPITRRYCSFKMKLNQAAKAKYPEEENL